MAGRGGYGVQYGTHNGATGPGTYPVVNPPENTAAEIASGFDESNWLDYAKSKADSGDVGWQEMLWNYFASEDSKQTARDWTAGREDNAYQRMVRDLEKAGISPYILSGATPVVSSSAGASYSGSDLVSRANNKDSNSTSSGNSAIQSFLRILGVVLAAAIYAL